MSEHNHDHENVRMDILKVNQKVFNQYPIGSKERLNLFRAKKLSELGAITEALEKMPAETVEIIATLDRHNSIFALMRSFLGVGLLAFVPLIWRMLDNVTGHVAAGLLAGLALGASGFHLSRAVALWRQRRDFLNAHQALRDRFDSIVNEIAQLSDKQ